MDEQGKTAPIELPGQEPAPSPPPPPHEAEAETPPAPIVIQPDSVQREAALVEAPPPLTPRAAAPGQQEVMFVPLAVSIGDGFKFGCGFFLAMVVASLAGFVVLGLVFVLISLIGLNVPVSP